jgi:hypothetical protein
MSLLASVIDDRFAAWALEFDTMQVGMDICSSANRNQGNQIVLIGRQCHFRRIDVWNDVSIAICDDSCVSIAIRLDAD